MRLFRLIPLYMALALGANAALAADVGNSEARCATAALKRLILHSRNPSPMHTG